MRKSWNDRWNFDKRAAEYDKNLKLTGYRFNVHQDYEVALEKVISTIQLKAGDTCLDIGIGTGNLSSRLLPKGIKVIGVDQSEKMLGECKRKHPKTERSFSSFADFGSAGERHCIQLRSTSHQ